MFGAPAAVGEGARQKRGIGERVSEPLCELVERLPRDQLCPNRPWT